jgi:predicted Zn-dependent protease
LQAAQGLRSAYCAGCADCSGARGIRIRKLIKAHNPSTIRNKYLLNPTKFARAGKDAESLQMFKKAQYLAPDDSGIREAIVRTYINPGQIQNAVQELEKYVQSAPEHILNKLFLGCLYGPNDGQMIGAFRNSSRISRTP